MRKTLWVLFLACLVSIPASAQAPPFQDPLLDRMIGTWVLRGTIGGAETTHDVNVDWVLGHQYVRLHEVSREKDAQGSPAYEAIVFVGWDQPSAGYACLWLDSTGGGGLKGQAIAYAKRAGDEIPFLFHGGDGSLFHTTFVYRPASDTWEWLMDGEEGGNFNPSPGSGLPENRKRAYRPKNVRIRDSWLSYARGAAGNMMSPFSSSEYP